MNKTRAERCIKSSSTLNDKDPKDKADETKRNIDVNPSLICDDCKSEDKEMCNHELEEQSSQNKGLSKSEKIKKLIPTKNYYSPIIPFSLSHQLLERYNKIFGDHSCSQCEQVEQKDYMSEDIFIFSVCKNYYLNLHAINVSMKGKI